MRRKFGNLNAYLLINLILICLLVAGLWRGAPLWDATIRLPNLLVLLVIINAVLIFRESFLGKMHRKVIRSEKAVDPLRRILGNREGVDDGLVQDTLAGLLNFSGDDGMSLLKIEESGQLSVLHSAGIIPAQFSGARLTIASNELKIRHPGGLGEEFVCRWESPFALIPFCSNITHLHLELIPLKLFGTYVALLVVFPGRCRKIRGNDPLQQIPYLESILALKLCKAQSVEGTSIDGTTGLLRYEGFLNAFETEVERSERYQQKMSLMLVSVACYGEFPNGAKESIQKAVAGAIRESLRRLDLSFSWRQPGMFAAILTETDSDVAKIVGDRIAAAFQKLITGKPIQGVAEPALHIGFATYPTDATHGNGLLEKAEEALTCSIREKVNILSFATARDMAK